MEGIHKLYRIKEMQKVFIRETTMRQRCEEALTLIGNPSFELM